MLTNGLTIEGKNDVVLASSRDVCLSCLLKEAGKDENKDVPLSVIRRKMEGQELGLMKLVKGGRDMDGNRIVLCHKCLKAFAEETAPDEN